MSGGKPAFARGVGHDGAREGEEQPRRFDVEHRTIGILRQVAQGHRAGIDQLEHEQRLFLRGMRRGLDGRRHLEGLGVELPVGDLHIQRELRLCLLDQALRRARILEAEILDVLAVHGERRGRTLLRLAASRVRRRRSGRHGRSFQYLLRRGGTMQGCTAQDAGRIRGRAIAKNPPNGDDIFPTICTYRLAMNRSSSRPPTLRPLVGISACLKENGRGGWHHTVGEKYVQAAVRAVGALPVLIPAIGPEFDDYDRLASGLGPLCSTHSTACC